MRYATGSTILAVMMLLVVASLFAAGVPQRITYQGRLTDTGGNPVTDGNYQISFAIYYTATGPSFPAWSSGTQTVTVTNGLFVYQLGSNVNLSPALFAADTSLYLGITVGTDPEITPRTRLVSVGFSCQAAYSDTADYTLAIADNAVTGDKIVDGTIHGDDIGDNGAANGQVLKWNGSTWTPADDNTGTGGVGGWTDDGNVVRLIDGADSIGIGTLTPSAKLDVDGSFHASGIMRVGNSLSFDGVNDKITATGGAIDFDDENLGTTGNVTIGESSASTPSLKLTVTGVTDASTPMLQLLHQTTFPTDIAYPVMEVRNQGYDHAFLTIDGGGTVIQSNLSSPKNRKAGPVTNQISPDDARPTFFNAGNVGIGTDDPTEPLSIAGYTDDHTPVVKLYHNTASPTELLNPAFEIYLPAYDYTPVTFLGGGVMRQRAPDETVTIELNPSHGGLSYLSAGPVGIGTNTPDPAFALDVGGDMNVQGEINSQGKLKAHSLTVGFDFDSGWLAVSPGTTIQLDHNLGGDPGNYVVFVYGKNTSGIHQANFGNAGTATNTGVTWHSLNETSLKITRGNLDSAGGEGDWDEVRIRIIANQQ
ncbi:MAG: hypothetical protein JW763_08795 [candidate division Zixibacteria bacterium]|nr:hypothetical protein [candidate division Zixibacteria bacterium]